MNLRLIHSDVIRILRGNWREEKLSVYYILSKVYKIAHDFKYVDHTRLFKFCTLLFIYSDSLLDSRRRVQYFRSETSVVLNYFRSDRSFCRKFQKRNDGRGKGEREMTAANMSHAFRGDCTLTTAPFGHCRNENSYRFRYCRSINLLKRYHWYSTGPIDFPGESTKPDFQVNK